MTSGRGSRVVLSRSFWIARDLVTNAQFERFAPDHPRTEGALDDDPVVEVSWEDASAFARWLAGKEGRPIHRPRAGRSRWALATSKAVRPSS